ncbi:hypothetical protein CG747_41610 [Streptomyces sp. CB02959]|nr:hypothetical protein CG747_41610 [Streptomyces sp. CB02959]
MDGGQEEGASMGIFTNLTPALGRSRHDRSTDRRGDRGGHDHDGRGREGHDRDHDRDRDDDRDRDRDRGGRH